ncbi:MULTISPECIES: class I SAM-dependent methyltransferase [unclassified Blastococcus]
MASRLFAALYDRALQGTEDAGLRAMRAELLTRARGEVLEVGAGTGHNVVLYPDAVTRLVLTEPSPHMARRLRARLAAEGSGRAAEVVEAPAESLPFADASFDTVVSTLVLCSVGDLARAAAELYRVLRPGGTLLYLEHVRGDGGRLVRWQDRLERPWGWFADGCHPNRATEAALRRAGFTVGDARRAELPKAPGLVRPLAVGAAGRDQPDRPTATR